MVGFYGGAPLEYAGLAEQGSDAVPASAGEVAGAAFGQGLAANPFNRMMRAAGRSASETGVVGVDDYGRPITVDPEPAVDPTTLNEKYGIKGHLNFDRAMPESAAQDLFDHKREELVRQDIIDRRNSGVLTGTVARMGVSMAAGLLDPINIAAGLVPVVGEARVASILGRGAIEAMGAAERAGVRAIAGGVSGGAAMAGLQPLEYALSRSELEDYTMAQALHSIALGTVLGGGLHVVGGAVADRLTDRYANPVTQRIEDAGPEARATMLQGAVAQHLDGRPVDVAPVLDLAEATKAEPAPIRVEAGTPERLIERAQRRPDDIVDFLRKEGGVQDSGGELRAMDLHKPVPGKFGILVRRDGLQLDHAREIAEEAGFLPQGSTINDLLNALRDTQQGRPVYRPEEAALWHEVQRQRASTAQAAARPELSDPFSPDNLFGDIEPTPAQRQAQAIDTMAQPPAAPVSDMARAATEAARAPSEPIAAVEQQIADMEARLAPPETPATGAPAARAPTTETSTPAAPVKPAEVVAADAEIETAHARAAAYERAANCIIRGG